MPKGFKHSHALSISTVLELVNLAVADVIVIVGQAGRLGAGLDVAPAALLLAGLAVEAQGGGEHDAQGVAHAAGEELNVDVERHLRGIVVGRGRDARHAVVLCLVVVCHHEAFLKELGVAGGHGCGGLFFLSDKAIGLVAREIEEVVECREC